MAEDENKNAPPESEGTEPDNPEGGGETERAPAAKKKPAAKKASHSNTDTQAQVEVQLAARDTTTGGSDYREPPKSIWWQALLMVVVVVFAFSIIRGLAKGPQQGAASVGAPSAYTPLADESEATGGEIIIEEAPSIPPDDSAASAPDYYGSPYPPQHPYYAQPPQGGSQGQPPYPMPPHGGYGYGYGYPPPWVGPYGYWGGYHHPWHPPYPVEPAPAPQEPEQEQAPEQ